MSWGEVLLELSIGEEEAEGGGAAGQASEAEVGVQGKSRGGIQRAVASHI